MVLVPMVACLQGDGKIVYSPGEDCLPYDDSVVPDCEKYLGNTLSKYPFFKEHSSSKYRKESNRRKEQIIIKFD